MDWIDLSSVPTPNLFPGTPPIIARILPRRGIMTPEAARGFLEPQLYSPAPPAQLPGVITAADRLESAIRDQDSICIWGDFDADGQTSTVILFETLRDLGANVTYHIPVRSSEGHGLNIPYLQKLINDGVKLILTCDTGISAHEAVKLANTYHVKVVITDHHDLPGILPCAEAIINPNLLPKGHPLSSLSGAGVAYKLSEELFERFNRQNASLKLLELAALGLVADLVLLTGDARYLVQRGLEMLRNTQRVGLHIMMEIADLIPDNLTEEHISYVLAPRLNALGRLGDANQAVDFLTTSDRIRARVIATQIEGMNIRRQFLCNQVTQAAEKQLRAEPSLLDRSILILENPSWPAGVLGIAASRLVERYQKPVILFSSPPGEQVRGSARSLDGLDITSAIAKQNDLLLNFGGHPMAAGLSLEIEHVPEFSLRMEKIITEMMENLETEAGLEIEGWLKFPEISFELVNELERLAPFGPGNTKPVFATGNLKILSASSLGRQQEHLRLKLVDEAGNAQTVMWWNSAEERESLPDGPLDLAYCLRAFDWRGSPKIELELVDFHPLEAQRIDIRRKTLEVVDHRNSGNLASLFSSLESEPSTMLWAEGKERRARGGKDRYQLSPANILVIWSIPPSSEELNSTLDKVHPNKVILVAAGNPEDSIYTFLERLLGLLKYSINHHAGVVSLSGLTSATSQRAKTVSKGLEWLVSHGEIKFSQEREDQLTVSKGNAMIDQANTSRLWMEIQSLLAETAAYRAFFKHAGKERLFESFSLNQE